MSIKISTTASPVPNVAISSRLEDPMFHTVLVENGGSCQASPALLLCAAGLTLCNGQCVNLASDPVNCGSCGNVCEAPGICSVGSCTVIPK
jgi:hypothetical protein